MDWLLTTFLLIVLPLVVALAGYSYLRRRGRRTGTAGCGAVVLGLVVSFTVVAAMTIMAVS